MMSMSDMLLHFLFLFESCSQQDLYGISHMIINLILFYRKEKIIRNKFEIIIQYNTVKPNLKGLAVLLQFRDSFGLKKAKIKKRKFRT